MGLLPLLSLALGLRRLVGGGEVVTLDSLTGIGNHHRVTLDVVVRDTDLVTGG